MSRARGCLRWAGRAAGGLAVVGYAAYCGLFWGWQDGFVYQVPDWADQASLHAVAAARGTRELALRSADGTPLLGWHQADGHDRLVLFLSGNGEALSDYVEFHDLVRERGFDLATVAWHGYPGSGGAPGQRALVDDAAALWDWALGQGYAPERIVVHGRSLGGGVAVQLLAGGRRPGALVLESTFGKLRWVLARWAPGLPYPLLLRSPFDSVGAARSVPTPALVLAARGDDLIPPEVGGRELVRALPDAVYVEVGGLSHQHDLPVSSPEARLAWEAFVEARVPATPR